MLADAKQIRNTLADQLRQHQKVCRDCTTLTPIRNRWCEQGWDLARQLAAARSRVTELENTGGGQQLTLL